MAAYITNQSTRSLRIAVLIEGATAPRWLLGAIGSALDVPGVHLTGWFQVSKPASPSAVESLFQLFNRLDAQILCKNQPAFDQLCILANLGKAALGTLQVDYHGEISSASAESLQALLDFDLDVVLCCCSRPLKLPKALARHGAWAIEIGYGVSALQPWAGAVEIAAKSHITVVRVVDYASPELREMYCSVGATIHNSVRRNRLRAVSKCQALFQRLLSGLLSADENQVRPRMLQVPLTYPRQKKPSISLLLNTVQRMLKTILNNRLGLGSAGDRWHIAYAFSDEALPTIPYAKLHYLKPPAGCFWADPFPVQYDDRHFILFEELESATERGRLLAIEVFENQEASAPVVVLENQHHLSYPFVFHWQDQLYMIPETSSQGRVELLRCVEFPGRWERQKVMLDNIQAVDATLWEQDGVWWMFVNIASENADLSDELHLYFSDSPLGEWQAHPSNPICSDIRCARPGGPLFMADGQLFRPSQDCAERYGHALWINRIEQLDQKNYRESPVRRIKPEWREDVTRIHTLARAGRLTVLDCSLEKQRRIVPYPSARPTAVSKLSKTVTESMPVKQLT
jgi:hypothetical protein